MQSVTRRKVQAHQPEALILRNGRHHFHWESSLWGWGLVREWGRQEAEKAEKELVVKGLKGAHAHLPRQPAD